MTERTQPHDRDAEQAVLGAMLMSRNALNEIAGLLDSSDFYVHAHECVFAAILAVDAAGQGCDVVTVSRELERRGDLKRVGGAPYLNTLVSSVVTPANAGYHAQIVREHAVRRRLVEVGTRITQMGYTTDDGSDLAEIVDRAQAEAGTLTRGADPAEETIADTLDGMLDEIERGVSDGLATGFRDLDQLTQGFKPGQMVIIGARPSVGKTTAGMDIIRHVSIRNRIPSAMFSLEMTRKQLIRRAMSAEGRINLHHLAPNCMTPEDWARVAKVREQIVTAPIHLDDSSGLTMMAIRAKARRLHREKGVRLLVVDYAQLVASGTARRQDSKQAEVTAVSNGLKLLAKELMIPVVVLAQLNRETEKRTDKRPVLSDLKDSGSLEQDADIVILLHREDAYERESPRAGEADLIVAKHRDGPTATITVAFQGHYSRFIDMAQS